jgi:hypothetical protein
MLKIFGGDTTRLVENHIFEIGVKHSSFAIVEIEGITVAAK